MFRKLWDRLWKREPAAPEVQTEGAADETPDPNAQANVERSLTYRRDYYKYALGIATGLLAFSVTLQPTLNRAPVHAEWLIPAWIGLSVAVFCGLRLHLLWAKFLVTFSDHRSDRKRGNQKRFWITLSRRIHDVLLVLGLVVGGIGMGAFAMVNLQFIAPKMETATGTVTGPGQTPPPDQSVTAGEPATAESHCQ